MLAILIIHCNKVMKVINTRQIKIRMGEWGKGRKGERQSPSLLFTPSPYLSYGGS